MRTFKLAALWLALASAPVLADPAPPAPDFDTKIPPLGVDRADAASDARGVIPPSEIVAFTADDATLDGNAVDQIDRAARWAHAHPRFLIVLEGHAATRDVLYGAELATERGEAVRGQLETRGIPADRIVVLVGAATRLDAGPRVVMFASDQPRRMIVDAALEGGHAVAARWTDRGTEFQLREGLGRPGRG